MYCSLKFSDLFHSVRNVVFEGSEFVNVFNYPLCFCKVRKCTIRDKSPTNCATISVSVLFYITDWYLHVCTAFDMLVPSESVQQEDVL